MSTFSEKLSTHPKSCTRAGNADPFLAEARLHDLAWSLVWFGACLGLLSALIIAVGALLLHAAGAI